MNKIKPFKDMTLSEISEVIEILSFILNKTDTSSSLKIILNAAILPFINILAPSRRDKILLSLTVILIFISHILKELNLEYLPFVYIAIVTSIAYLAFNFIALRKNSLNLAKTSTPYSSRLINAITGKRRMREEIAFEPDIEEYKIEEIKEKLFDLRPSQINKSIVYLSHQKDLSEKFDKYTSRFISYFFVLVTLLIYGKELSPLLIAGLGLFYAFMEYKLHKNFVSSKLGFCLRLLKEVQAEKDES
ncbi:hypothetical protein [Altericista sp. CCNU0014]|uniref:hypothetical protein n=1 Tax=Altericista sp. CCNU0014 TaxID=3082949 RepID=UPI00384FA7D4